MLTITLFLISSNIIAVSLVLSAYIFSNVKKLVNESLQDAYLSDVCYDYYFYWHGAQYFISWWVTSPSDAAHHPYNNTICIWSLAHIIYHLICYLHISSCIYAVSRDRMREAECSLVPSLYPRETCETIIDECITYLQRPSWSAAECIIIRASNTIKHSFMENVLLVFYITPEPWHADLIMNALHWIIESWT